MAWDIHVRRSTRHDRGLSHVQARWTSLGTIDDVWLQCGAGVQQVNGAGECRREMNAFSRPMEADFSWPEDMERPEVVLTWTDAGEECGVTIPLADSQGSLSHGLPHGLSSGLRRLLHTRTRAVVEPGDGLADLGRAAGEP